MVGVLRLTGRPVAESLLSEIRPLAVGMAFVAAATAMAGSLYYSESANFVPCRMCWIQRGFMYPSAAILLVSLVTKQVPIAAAATVLSVVGLGVAIFHRLEQAFPDNVGSGCSLDTPCSARWVNEFGFITIPTMAGVAFALVIVFTVIALTGLRAGTANGVPHE